MRFMTHSEPGNARQHVRHVNVNTNLHTRDLNYRCALQDERRQQPTDGGVMRQHNNELTGWGTRPKYQGQPYMAWATSQKTRSKNTYVGPPRQRVDEGELEGEYEYNDNLSNRGFRDDKVKSGFLDKPRSQVLIKQRWPHMNQNPRYVMSPLTFNQLNFCQFIGGFVQSLGLSSKKKSRGDSDSFLR